jgi:hypothetical protein
MRKRWWLLLAFLLLGGVACSGAPTPVAPTPAANPAAPTASPAATGDTVATSPLPAPRNDARTNPRVASNVPIRYSTDLGFDAIYPVYEPHFAPADEIPLDDEDLVLGVAWGGAAKAYPISVLRGREIVNDELAGIPTLVTW